MSEKGNLTRKPQILTGCIRCGACVVYCPAKAIFLAEKKAEIDPERCRGCMKCVHRCFLGAIMI